MKGLSGNARRAFERRFQLADTVEVTNAAHENGVLDIDLTREVPEHKKPRKIHIGAHFPQAAIDRDRAA